jgi:hypothetical protein
MFLVFQSGGETKSLLLLLVANFFSTNLLVSKQRKTESGKDFISDRCEPKLNSPDTFHYSLIIDTEFNRISLSSSGDETCG